VRGCVLVCVCNVLSLYRERLYIVNLLCMLYYTVCVCVLACVCACVCVCLRVCAGVFWGQFTMKEPKVNAKYLTEVSRK